MYRMAELNIAEIDLYELFELEIEASTNEIKKAYRKKALQCHPDKNPDDANASQKFHQLSKALEILTDTTARAAYDKVLKGRKEAAIRHKRLDSKRQKLKEELEKREKQSFTQKSADVKLREEIERLRKEGSKAVEEEMQYVLKKVKESLNQSSANHSVFRIKIKWTASKNDPSNGGYTQDILYKFLSKYGDIQALVMSPKKRGSALIEFKDRQAAEMAVDFEIGMPSNPLKLEWVEGPPKRNIAAGSLIRESDFESVTLTKLKQEEERKRLIAQMLAEDEKEDNG